MRIVTDLAGYEPDERGSVVTIGAYDGMHLGHQAVLRLVRELAAARGHEAVCLTFDRHPAQVVRRESAPRVLTTLAQKLELIEATGYVDTTCVLTFDEARSRESAEEFVREVLSEGLGARLVVVGVDFHFGHGRHGSVRLLEQMGAELGFETLGLGLIAADRDPSRAYSSTWIRQLLAVGDVAGAARLLGRPPRPYEVRGTVVVGDRRGRDLGFPTANIMVPPETCLPADGIYAGHFVGADGVERGTAISLGRRPTFYDQAKESLLEAYVLDFDDDLYGQAVEVRFIEHLRGEEHFDSVEALVDQIQRDVIAIRKILDRK
jgi:riboflavin kinase/FMN adenylyltransferase